MQVIDSGLPLSTVWVRVERLRAAAHWRPAAAADAEGEADPQRAPCAAEVQALLYAVRPSAALLLCVTALRLAQVPLLPRSEAVQHACAASSRDDEGEGALASLLALVRAHRRLTAEPESEPEAVRGALCSLVHPPHYLSDEAGYLTWVSALWEACCDWSDSPRGTLALVCWRLRWLHALVLAAPRAAEARRLRAQARRLLKQHAPDAPVAFALFARIEADAGDAEGARRAALQVCTY